VTTTTWVWYIHTFFTGEPFITWFTVTWPSHVVTHGPILTVTSLLTILSMGTSRTVWKVKQQYIY